MTKEDNRITSVVAATILLAVTSVCPPAAAQLTFSLTWGWQGDAREDAAWWALNQTVNRLNAYGDFSGGNGTNVAAAYNPGVPTAQANYGGWGGIIEYGGTWPNERVTLHELNHWLGSGTFSNANNLGFNGSRTVSIMEQFEGVGARISGDGVHFWPYGLNFDNEWSELNADRNVALMYALRADWGIGSTANPNAWNATSVTMTRSDNVGESGFNHRGMWSDNAFAHPNADYATGAHDLRTPQGYPSWTFAGKSLTISPGGRLLYNSWGHGGVTTVDDLRVNNGTVRHDQYDGNPNVQLDTFRLAGNVTVTGTGTFDAAEGDMVIGATVGGSGGFAKTGGYTLTLDHDNTYAGTTEVMQGTLVLNGATGFGAGTVSSGASLVGDGTVRGALTARGGSSLRVGEAGLPSVLSSGHVLIDDFNGYNTGATASTTNGEWGEEYPSTSQSNIVDFGGDRALQVIGGSGWSGAERALSGDAAVDVGETQTLYWQVRPSYTSDGSGWDYDFMMGLSPQISNIDSTDAWQDFAVMPFINNEATTPYINALSDASTWWALMTPGEWHNVWVVVNNDGTSPSYDLYYASASDPGNPILVSEDANWRGSESGIAPGVSLEAIGFMAAGNAGTEFLVDNIYYIEGESTVYPLGQPSMLVGETLTVGGDLYLEAGSTVSFDIAFDGVNDRIDIGGNLGVEDGFILEVLLDASASGLLTEGDTWDLFDFATASGTFDPTDFVLPSLTSGLVWDTSRLLIDGTLAVNSAVSGDFNNDGAWDCADIDALSAAIAAGSTDLAFDMNGDGAIDLADLTDESAGWLAVGGAVNSTATGGNAFLVGDANLDGTVDGQDFVRWNDSKFTSNSNWCDGNFNGDAVVDGQDFVAWNDNKFTSSSDIIAAVPEPNLRVAWVIAGLLLCSVGRAKATPPVLGVYSAIKRKDNGA